MNEQNDGTKAKVQEYCSIKRVTIAGLWGMCVLTMLPTLGDAGTTLIGLPAMGAPWAWWWHKDGSIPFNHVVNVFMALFLGCLGTLACTIPFLILKSLAH